MLKGIDPILTGETLALLDEMGHGDVLGLVDRNFPAYRYGVPVVSLRDSDIARVAQAVFSVFPTDQFVAEPLRRMEFDGDPTHVSEVAENLRRVASAKDERDVAMGSIERQRFYEEAKDARLFIQAGETAPYACFLVSKGVV